ncbi:hypothetical protein, partial [uncultured Parasutterella sp.]|uniref:hypothetical protein n=1 Tax=uncultured Parasutterella sp. TaxID=1263098 RepID=UPI0025986E12
PLEKKLLICDSYYCRRRVLFLFFDEGYAFAKGVHIGICRINCVQRAGERSLPSSYSSER